LVKLGSCHTEKDVWVLIVVVNDVHEPFLGQYISPCPRTLRQFAPSYGRSQIIRRKPMNIAPLGGQWGADGTAEFAISMDIMGMKAIIK